MKFTGTGFLVLLVLTHSVTANACTLAEVQSNFSKLNQVFLSYNRAIFAHKDRPAGAQAGAGAQDEADPDELQRLLEKRANIIEQTAAIRKLFAQEVQNKAGIKAQDALNPTICEKFSSAGKTHNIIIYTAPVKEERPICTKKDLRPRFIAATRKQRKLTLAGKVNGKERVNYLKMVTQFKKNSKQDFDEACNTLHEYEKRLKAEKSEE